MSYKSSIESLASSARSLIEAENEILRKYGYPRELPEPIKNQKLFKVNLGERVISIAERTPEVVLVETKHTIKKFLRRPRILYNNDSFLIYEFPEQYKDSLSNRDFFHKMIEMERYIREVSHPQNMEVLNKWEEDEVVRIAKINLIGNHKPKKVVYSGALRGSGWVL